MMILQIWLNSQILNEPYQVSYHEILDGVVRFILILQQCMGIDFRLSINSLRCSLISIGSFINDLLLFLGHTVCGSEAWGLIFE